MSDENTVRLRVGRDPQPQGRANHGARWDNEQLHELRRLWVGTTLTFPEICDTMGRSYDSILQRLCSLKLLRYNALDYSYYHAPRAPLINLETETKLENDMTQPLQNLTLIFGEDIKACTPEKLIASITKCQSELASLNNIPRNKWTDKRGEELKAAIAAAVDELNTRA